jgi:hypothetical protein
MVLQVHSKKKDDVLQQPPQLDLKKDATTATAAAAAAAANRKRLGKPLALVNDPRSHHRRSGTGVVLNTALSIGLFWCLVRWFDPTTTEPHLSTTTSYDTISNNAGSSKTGTKGTTSSIEQASMGRERILSLLQEAGISKDLTVNQIEKLPKWDQVRP